MKTKYILIILLSCIFCLRNAQGQTSTQNYIKSETVLTSGQTTDANVDALTYTGKRTHVEYYDGLGRLAQVNDTYASPNGSKDLITAVDYDTYGRQAKDYLPFAGAQGMAYHTTPTAVANWTTYYGSTDDDYAFSQKSYESSPLNRVLEQAAPGYSFRQGSGNTVKVEYGPNAVSDAVRYYNIYSSGALNLFSGAYPIGSLSKTTTWDENNAQSASTSRTIEFKDKLGRVVLKRNYNGTTAFSTYYAYNDKGLLCYVIPPKATPDDGMITSTELDQLCYQYIYDERNRLIERKLPGAGWEYLIYDLKDRLVLTQDAKLRGVNANQYHYTLYDALNRPAEQGISTESSAYASLRTTVKASSGYTPATRDAQVYTYYDNYTTPSTWGYAYVSVYSQHTQTTAVKGLVTGVKTKLLGTGTWLYTVNYYDKYYRLLQQYQTNPEGGYNRVSFAYDFEGKNTDKQTLHKRLATDTGITLYEQFVYDHMGRVTASKFGYNTTTLTTLASNTYDELGRLSSKQQHGGLQYSDYLYNIRGWLTQINDPTVAVSNDKLFAMKLFYDTDMTTTLTGNAQFNGNINGMMWRRTNDAKKGYNFSYDGLNRLMAGDYGTYSGSWATSNANDLTIASYDANGNINGLSRNNSSGVLRDNLAYTYTGNQLASVSGTYSGTNKSGNFTYDTNGNAISDGLRGITTIGYYPEINLPRQYLKDASNKVDYQYDATGNKWNKTATISGTPTATLYYGPFIYQSGSLSIVLTPEGYYDVPTTRYHYYLKDHLGNTRVTYYYSGTTATVAQEVEYDPFGYMLTDNIIGNNKYLYNGKELNGEFFENYDFSARYCDVQLGRWHVVDPMAEKYYSFSPYHFSGNNPMRFLDLNGMNYDDYYINKDASIRTVKTDDSFDRFYVQDDISDTGYKQVAQLDKNEAGLVQFPATGTGFDKFGSNDAGGTSTSPPETVGQGDHFLKPITAAALFGVADKLNSDYGLTISFGDMSSSNGSDPWQSGSKHHAGHGHLGKRSGLDVDFRYMNTEGESFQSSNAFNSSSFSSLNNQRVFDAAAAFGFTKNYQGTSGNLTGATKVGGHNDHGHLGFQYNSLNWKYISNAPIRQSIFNIMGR